VEEHFYILWPFAVRFLPRRSLIIILLSLVALEPLARAIASFFVVDWQFVYFLTPFRLDGLAFGSLLAVASESMSSLNAIKSWSGWATLLFIALWFCFRVTFGLSFTRDNPTALYNSLCYSIVSLVALSLIAWVITHPESIVVTALSWKPLVATGVISYGLYLYQVILRELVMRTWHVNIREALWIDTPVLFLFAWASFAFYERPLIRWGKRRAARLNHGQSLSVRGTKA
jgi:peptidoglycan/LPS O-acetylase OafA/YrhL